MSNFWEIFICSSVQLNFVPSRSFPVEFVQKFRKIITVFRHIRSSTVETMYFISLYVIFSIWPNYRLMPDIQLATSFELIRFSFAFHCEASVQYGCNRPNVATTIGIEHKFKMHFIFVSIHSPFSKCVPSQFVQMHLDAIVMHHILNKMHQMALNCYSNNSIVAYTLVCVGIREKHASKAQNYNRFRSNT